MTQGYQDCRYQEDINFSDCESDIIPVAFYLPQFHEIPENNEWWGKGFTEWTNTKKSQPRFDGHYMPRVPHCDIGYYDLSDYHVLMQQAQLARRHGIQAFCFYYYWFSGKRLLERPMDLLIDHPEIDINFCLCWANENWTRTWDGQSKHMLIKQGYLETDPKNFVIEMKKYVTDKRYLKIDDKPVIIVYAPQNIPNAAKVFQQWRDTAMEIGIGDLYIATCRTFMNSANSLKLLSYIDAEIEFPPHNVSLNAYDDLEIQTSSGKGNIMSYRTMVEEWDYSYSPKPVFRTVMMGWDNSARRKNGWSSFNDFSLRFFLRWLRLAIKHTRENLPIGKRFLFINAWNEWGEGTYLEPDEKYGYMILNTLSRAIFNCNVSNGENSKIDV